MAHLDKADIEQMTDDPQTSCVLTQVAIAIAATNRLFERNPDAQPFGIRIGHRAVYHFGARSLKQNP